MQQAQQAASSPSARAGGARSQGPEQVSRAGLWLRALREEGPAPHLPRPPSPAVVTSFPMIPAVLQMQKPPYSSRRPFPGVLGAFHQPSDLVFLFRGVCLNI